MNIQKFTILMFAIIFLTEIISASATNISDGSVVVASRLEVPLASSVAVPSASGIAVSSNSDLASSIALSDYKFKDWGEYESISMKGERYFSGYVDSSNESNDLFFRQSTGQSSLYGKYLEKILVDSNTVMNLASGSTLKLQEGYELAIKSIDIDGNKIFLELTRNGSVINSRVISPSKSGATVADKTYYYENPISGGEKKLVILAVHFEDIIIQSGKRMATIDGIWQISDSPIQYNPSSNKFTTVPYKSTNYASNGAMQPASEAAVEEKPAEVVAESAANPEAEAAPEAAVEEKPAEAVSESAANPEAEAVPEAAVEEKPAEVVAESAANPEAEAVPEAAVEEKPAEAVAESAARPETEAAPEGKTAESGSEEEASATSAGTNGNGRKPIALGQIADDIPDKMYAKKVYTVTAYITEDITENITEQPVWGSTPTVAKAKVGDNMSVRLSGGDNFIITPLSEEVQSLALEGNATWQWHVEALIAGEQTLSLSADIILANGEVHHYRTYEHTVHVSVDKETIGQFIQDNWQWLASSLAATIIALAGFLKWLYPLIKSRSKKEE